MARAESGLATKAGAQRARSRAGGRALAWSAAAFALALAAYVADVATHPIRLTLGWFDLNIYNHAGLIVRHAPDTLYTWHFLPGVQYLYTPFAALGFAARLATVISHLSTDQGSSEPAANPSAANGV